MDGRLSDHAITVTVWPVSLNHSHHPIGVSRCFESSQPQKVVSGLALCLQMLHQFPKMSSAITSSVIQSWFIPQPVVPQSVEELDPNRDKSVWTELESTSLMEYVRQSGIVSPLTSSFWKTCAQFLNTIFKTNRTGQWCLSDSHHDSDIQSCVINLHNRSWSCESGVESAWFWDLSDSRVLANQRTQMSHAPFLSDSSEHLVAVSSYWKVGPGWLDKIIIKVFIRCKMLSVETILSCCCGCCVLGKVTSISWKGQRSTEKHFKNPVMLFCFCSPLICPFLASFPINMFPSLLLSPLICSLPCSAVVPL